MREIIAERDKSFFLLMVAVGLVSAAGCIIGSIYYPHLLWLYIFGISVMGLITLVGLIGLCFPRWVIIMEENAVIIHNGFRGFKKVRIEIADIVDAKAQELSQQGAVKQTGNIVLTVKSENSLIKDIVVINIKNSSEVAEKLNSLIQK